MIIAAGVLGSAGVALAAAASHIAEARLLGAASAMCLAHAPALLAVRAAQERFAFARMAALLIAVGTLVFSGDLVARVLLDAGLFPSAAPIGGAAMIAGWMVIAVGGVLGPGRRSAPSRD